ncbi:MAG TPA: hypothetical protein VM737_04805 [Gemmatimonadota bacterium]|nr:hypothetical protein [Gemmatimonadota bacterium]
MKTLLRPFLYSVFLFSILLAAACETDEGTQVGADVEEATGVDGDEDFADDDMLGDDIDVTDDPLGEEATYELVVVNPMPHSMIVSIDQDGDVEELGQVPANGRLTFHVPAPAGSTVTLLARDEAKTHTPMAEITLPVGDAYATWTIE